MEPAKIPTKEEVVEKLEKIRDNLPDIIEKAKQGIFDTVENERMIVLQKISKGIVSVSVKRYAVLFSVR